MKFQTRKQVKEEKNQARWNLSFSRVSNHLVYICHSIFIIELKGASSSCCSFISLKIERNSMYGTISLVKNGIFMRKPFFFFLARRNGKYDKERERERIFIFLLFKSSLVNKSQSKGSIFKIFSKSLSILSRPISRIFIFFPCFLANFSKHQRSNQVS